MARFAWSEWLAPFLRNRSPELHRTASVKNTNLISCSICAGYILSLYFLSTQIPRSRFLLCGLNRFETLSYLDTCFVLPTTWHFVPPLPPGYPPASLSSMRKAAQAFPSSLLAITLYLSSPHLDYSLQPPCVPTYLCFPPFSRRICVMLL